MNGWPLIIISFFNSILKTEYVGLAQTITGMSRMIIGVPLVYLGLDFYGVMVGYVTAALISDIIYILWSSPRKSRAIAMSIIE
ncbi:MAG: hypothetical protein ABDH32_05340 [Candidatus Caldarchaeales archaeon]